MNQKDKAESEQYLRQCADKQVLGVLEKERNAGRAGYARLAEQEANRRNLEI